MTRSFPFGVKKPARSVRHRPSTIPPLSTPQEVAAYLKSKGCTKPYTQLNFVFSCLFSDSYKEGENQETIRGPFVLQDCKKDVACRKRPFPG
jgi:hypothetical protein